MGFPLTTVALVGFRREDEISIKAIFDNPECVFAPDCSWKFRTAHSVDTALEDFQREPVPVAMCDHDHMPAAWKALLEQFADLAKPPMMIVTSRLADERLWAEALNLGAYDVLARPFDGAEVIRSVGSASLHWRSRYAVSVYGAGSAA